VKKIIQFMFLLSSMYFMQGCKKDKYPGGVVSPYIALFDVRNLYHGTDVTLTKDNMFGADKITGMVISDHSGHNLPQGLLVLEDSRRLSQLRGIAVPVGSAAASYVPGDSVIIKVEGAVLRKVNGILQIVGVSAANITKVSSGNAVAAPIIKSNVLLASPGAYESTLISIMKVGFDASYPAGTTYAGNKIINDGFGNILLHTEQTAPFAGNAVPYLSNYTGIVFNVNTDTLPQLWPRVSADVIILTSTPPKIAAVVITGYLVDPAGTDANYEYIQCMATRNINFAVNNFSVVTTNNAGTSTPINYPTNGWATGDLRTYKFDLTSGTGAKGEYFYIGGNKNIWGAGSTDISSSKWFGKMYSTIDGDGFGTKTANILANSGNAAGIAVFDLTAVSIDTIPVDVIFYGGNGSLYTAGPPAKGYRIANTDYYDLSNLSTQESQPFFAMGSNTGRLAFPAATKFSKLGGTYNTTTGRWTGARTLIPTDLTTTSTVAVIEGATTLEQ
jgi:hypothetical protein